VKEYKIFKVRKEVVSDTFEFEESLPVRKFLNIIRKSILKVGGDYGQVS